MENIFISFLLIEILFTTILIINCAMDELLPIKEYKKYPKIKTGSVRYIYLLQLYLLFLQQLLYISFFSLCS